MAGSLGRSHMLDGVYFMSNCMTDLSELDGSSVVFTEPRIHKHFTSFLKADQCYGYREDMILCSRHPEKYPPANGQIAKFEAEGGCEAQAGIVACKTDSASCTAAQRQAVDDCDETARRRKCRVARSANPCIDEPCQFHSAGPLTVGGELRDAENGISDLEFYDVQFDAAFGHAARKPRDLMMSMGLHTAVLFFMDNAISIANDPVEDINEDSTYFHRIYKYANNELASGQEIAGGLFKAILIITHDALTLMDNNTQITVVAFTMIVLVILAQFVILALKIGSVVHNYVGVAEILQRFLQEARELERALQAAGAAAEKEARSDGIEGSTRGNTDQPRPQPPAAAMEHSTGRSTEDARPPPTVGSGMLGDSPVGAGRTGGNNVHA